MKKRFYKFGYFALRLGMVCGILFGAIGCAHKDKAETQETAGRQSGQEETTTRASISEKYPNANDRMVYLPMVDGTIQQWSLDGVYQQSFSLSSEEFMAIDLLWVNNEELIWRCNEEKYRQSIQATPIHRTETGEEVVLEQTKELFRNVEEDSYIEVVDANQDVVIYLSGGANYVYDRKSGGKPEKIKGGTQNQDSPMQYIAGATEDWIIYHTGRESGTLEENAYGFWCYDWKRKQTKNIDARCFSTAAYVADSVRRKVYYQVTEDQSIWEYDCQTGERTVFISEEQWKRCFKDNDLTWDDAYYNDSLYVEGDVVYFVKNNDDPQIFSYSLSKAALSYEKELTEVVRQSGYCEEAAMASVSGGVRYFLSIVEGKILLFWTSDPYGEESGENYICIDMATAEMKAVTKSDPEKVYFGMIGEWESPGTTAEWKRSEGTKADFAKKASGSLSVQEQLACISRHASVWLVDRETGEVPMEYFAVTDLDHNGRLEVIASTGAQGSGAFTHSEFYQVSADGTGLRHISGELREDDIVKGIKTAYVDTKNHLYYYCTEDYVSAGAGDRCCSYGAMVLKNGMLTRRAYAGMEAVWNAKGTKEEWHYYRFRNGKKKKISPKKFDQNRLADDFFDGFQKKSVKISWFPIRNKGKLTEEQIKKKLTKSYQGFR